MDFNGCEIQKEYGNNLYETSRLTRTWSSGFPQMSISQRQA